MNYFEWFGIPETLRPDKKLLRKKWQDASRVYHPDKYANATGAELAEALQKSALNNDAYRTLNDEDAILAYVLKESGAVHDDEKYNLPADFLMEMMELNEAIGAAGSTGDANEQYTAAMQDWRDRFAPLEARYESGERGQALLDALKDSYFRKKYLLRLKQRLA